MFMVMVMREKWNQAEEWLTVRHIPSALFYCILKPHWTPSTRLLTDLWVLPVRAESSVTLILWDTHSFSSALLPFSPHTLHCSIPPFLPLTHPHHYHHTERFYRWPWRTVYMVRPKVRTRNRTWEQIPAPFSEVYLPHTNYFPRGPSHRGSVSITVSMEFVWQIYGFLL